MCHADQRRRKRANTARGGEPPRQRHPELYELSAQEPSEIDILDQIGAASRTARTLREDFCGTAAVSIEWVKRRGDNHATGVDLDRPTLDWTLGRMDGLLDENQKSRINLIEGDVLSTKTDAVDTFLATNFSYFIFKSRDQLRSYFEIVRDGLVDDGLFILDAYGE